MSPTEWELCRFLVPAAAMTTAAKDVRGFRAAFAISAAIITVALGVAMATRMGAFLWFFHALPLALWAPLGLGSSGTAGLPLPLAFHVMSDDFWST